MDPRREIAFVMHLEKSGFTADKTKQLWFDCPDTGSG